MELLGRDRRARPGGGGRLRAAARRVLRAADPGPAGHDRHRLLRRPGGPAAAGGAVPAGARPQGGPGGRPRRGRADSPAGELDGVRLLSPRTVAFMGHNHLPGGVDLETFGRPLNPEAPFRGVGFGLGFAVVIDPVPGKVVCSPGELSWGGMASTAFWVDPAEELTVSFFTQLIPSSAHPIRPQLRQLVYQALV